jgi:fibronectin-binding autotransporter adhesin
LTGESDGYTGLAEVPVGTLAVTGKRGGAVTVASAGRLEGTGTIGALANAGAVAPGQGGFGTLTVAGDYAGNNGTLEIEAALAGDDSPSDRLVVNGSTAGKTEVHVVNKGGFGAATKDGVKIVDVAGASNGTFTL